jgi:hypothetical protein
MASIPWDGCGEDGQFVYGSGSGLSMQTASNRYRPAYSRYGRGYSGGGYDIRIWPQGTLSSGWATARVWCNADSGDGTQKMWGMVDASSNLRLYIILNSAGDGPGGPFYVYKVNSVGATTLLGTTTGGFNYGPSVPDKFDADFNYSTSGHLNLYVNGTQIFSYSGDITTDGVSALAGTYHGAWAPSFGALCSWSEHYTDAGASTLPFLGLKTMNATGAGTLDQWTGAYTNAAQETVNDANFDAAGSAGDAQRYAMSSGVSGIVLAVFTELRAEQGTLSNLKVAQLIGGTQYLTAAQTPPGAFSYPGVLYVQPNSPASGVAWMPAELNTSFEAGYQAD